MKRNHRNLQAWQQAMELVTTVYGITSTFPDQEKSGLASQIRQAAIAVPSNIAEAFARSGSDELLRFLGAAAGSLSELDTLIELAARLGYLYNAEELNEKADEISGLIMDLTTSIRRHSI